jgi:uncharacterized protein (TIGR03437 family)
MRIRRELPGLGLLAAMVCGSGIAETAGPVVTLAHLADVEVNAIRTDASGNIYLAGIQGTAPDGADAIVVKLTPDGSRVLYSTKFAGAKFDAAMALDIDSAGAAYILGQTRSPDFPVTAGAFQNSPGGASQAGFVAKVDPSGQVVWATLIGGGADVYPYRDGLKVNAAGEVIASGQTVGAGISSTPGAPFTSADTNTDFVLKLDAAGAKLVAAIRGVGGRLATDDQGSIYLAGSKYPSGTAIPLSPLAFQTSFDLRLCAGTGQLGIACAYQYVTKLNAGLTQILFSTYLTGSYGAAPAAIFVDAQRNVWIAGTTNSPDFPVTPDALQSWYVANAAPPPQTCLFGCNYPPPASGFVTKLNATGTALLYSTFFSGTEADTIDFAAFTSAGLYVSGQARSSDLPGFFGEVPAPCLPRTFVTRLSTDAQAVGAARVADGKVLAWHSALGRLLAWSGSDLLAIDPAGPVPGITCILDAADVKPATSIAPGELLSLFGPRLAEATAGVAPGFFPTSMGKVSVVLNTVASPLMYVSRQQINFQAPFEIAGASQANLVLTGPEGKVSDSRAIPVAARNPVAFLDTATPASALSLPNCPSYGVLYSGGALPLAFNSDGSRNSCANPAKPKSLVRIFLGGLGVTDPVPVTGSVNPNPGAALNLPVSAEAGGTTLTVTAVAAPGSISGVWQVDVTMPENQTGAITVSLSVDGVPVRDRNLTIWVR